MKVWVRLPKGNPGQEEISISEKEIATLTVKLSAMAPDKVRAAVVPKPSRF